MLGLKLYKRFFFVSYNGTDKIFKRYLSGDPMILLKKITFETSTQLCNTTGILFALERKAQISKQMNKANTWIVKVFLTLRPCYSLPPWTENASSLCVYPAGTILYVHCLWITLMWFFFSFSDHAIKSMKTESKFKASLGFAWCMKHMDSHSSLLTLWKPNKD